MMFVVRRSMRKRRFWVTLAWNKFYSMFTKYNFFLLFIQRSLYGEFMYCAGFPRPSPPHALHSFFFGSIFFHSFDYERRVCFNFVVVVSLYDVFHSFDGKTWNRFKSMFQIFVVVVLIISSLLCSWYWMCLCVWFAYTFLLGHRTLDLGATYRNIHVESMKKTNKQIKCTM